MEWMRALTEKIKMARDTTPELQYEREARLAKDKERDAKKKKKDMTFSAITRNRATANTIAGLED